MSFPSDGQAKPQPAPRKAIDALLDTVKLFGDP
jgi:hypothetical protein